MHQDLQQSGYPALELMLLIRLWTVICLQREAWSQELLPTSSEKDDWLLSQGSQTIPVPLQRAKKSTQILYVSAIAFKLEKICQIPAVNIATQILTHLGEDLPVGEQTVDPSPLAIFWQNFVVTVVPPGWIQFQLLDPGLAAWLQWLVDTPLEPDQFPPDRFRSNQGTYLRQANDSSDLFEVQYAHARCCSLLRLAQQEGLIQLRQVNPFSWQISTPTPVPWLQFTSTGSTAAQTCNQKGQVGGQLRLLQPAEQLLISQLVTLLDELCCSTRQRPVLKLAIALSQAFQNFYRTCRIWGEVKATERQLAQARLGLVLISRSLLRFMLQDLLGVSAPEEL